MPRQVTFRALAPVITQGGRPHAAMLVACGGFQAQARVGRFHSGYG